MLVALALALQSPPPDASAILATHREATRVSTRCTTPTDSSEITVCARRDADRYRVPLVEVTPGDPRHESVAAERTRYLARTTPCQDRGAFLIGCGMVGVTMTTGGGRTSVGTFREPAP